MSGHDLPPANDRVAVGVVEAVADAAGTDPRAMEPPLYEAIDTDALERLVGGDGRVSVTFDYAGHTVTVDSDGMVSVDGELARAWATTPTTERLYRGNGSEPDVAPRSSSAAER